MENGLQINDLQTIFSENISERTFPAQSRSFKVFWVLEGNGSYFADHHEQPITNDTVYCTAPGQAHVFNVTGSLKGYALSFTSDFLCPLNGDSSLFLNSGLFSIHKVRAIRICIETKAEMEQLLHSMSREYTTIPELKTEILRALMKLFLVHLIRKAGINRTEHLEGPGDVHLVSQYLDLVQKHFMTVKKVSDYAKLLRLSSNYLNFKIKQVTGFPASHHIQQRIVLEAKRQACWGRLSLKETAYLLGYDDLSHFSKFFKKAAGVCFSNFKRLSHGTIA